MLLLLFLQFSGSTGFSWCFHLPLVALVLAFGCWWIMAQWSSSRHLDICSFSAFFEQVQAEYWHFAALFDDCMLMMIWWRPPDV